MFVIVVTYLKSIEVVDAYLAAHRDYLEIGYQKNYLFASGPQHPRTGGVVLSQLTDRAVLEAFLAGDPFSINGIAEYQVIEFTPVKYHAEFAGFVTS
jgi:uncharacterized protein YciI